MFLTARIFALNLFLNIFNSFFDIFLLFSINEIELYSFLFVFLSDKIFAFYFFIFILSDKYKKYFDDKIESFSL